MHIQLMHVYPFLFWEKRRFEKCSLEFGHSWTQKPFSRFLEKTQNENNSLLDTLCVNPAIWLLHNTFLVAISLIWKERCEGFQGEEERYFVNIHGIVWKWKKTLSFIAKSRTEMLHPQRCDFKECLLRGDYST